MSEPFKNIRQYDENNRFSVAGNIMYAYPNISPAVLWQVVDRLGDLGAGLWLDKHVGSTRCVQLTEAQIESLKEAEALESGEFLKRYSTSFSRIS